MSSVSLFPKGGIVLGSDLYIMTWGRVGGMSKDNLWVLCSTLPSESYPTNLIFRLAIDDSGTAAAPFQTTLNTLITFTVTGASGGGYTFVAKTPGYNLGAVTVGDKEIVTGLTTDPPQPVFMTESNFQPWTAPASLLTGVGYVASYSAGGSGFFWQFASSATDSLITTFVGFLPTIYYYGCKAGTSKQSQTASDVLLLAWCSLSSKKNLCPNVPTIGWVSQPDCVSGQNYSYCSNTQTCSTSCVSQTCPSEQSCIYVKSNADGQPGFECSAPITDSAPTSHKIWLIVGIVVGFIVLILFIIIIKHLHNGKATPGIEPADIDDALEDDTSYEFGHDDDA